MKKIQLNVNEEVYEAYQRVMKDNDTSVAVEIRQHMKCIVSKNDDAYREKHNITDEPVTFKC